MLKKEATYRIPVDIFFHTHYYKCYNYFEDEGQYYAKEVFDNVVLVIFFVYTYFDKRYNLLA